MDLQKKNDESLSQSEKELPSNIIDLILSDDLEKDPKLEIEANITENDENSHTETKQTCNGQTIFTPEEEEKNDDIDTNLKYKSNVEEETNENENFEKLEQSTAENTSEKRVVNGIFTDDSAGKSLELLWAEAIKAQNEGRYKDAIHNFTQIYENKHSTPELKHKTKCRLVFALYQDNQADEAEKIGWESEIVQATADKDEGNTKTIATIQSNDSSPSTDVSQDKTEQDHSSSKTSVAVESEAIVDGTKSTSPTSALDEDESTMTRISECSDDSNLIKLDLSQLVGEPNTNSDDTKEVEITKSDVKEEEEKSPDKAGAPEETNEAMVIDVRNDESEVTVRITSIPSPVSELEAKKATMAATDAANTKKKERKKKKASKAEASSSKNILNQFSESNLNCLHCNVKFYNKCDFQAHCRTEKHQHTVMSDEGRSWKYRPPPRGVGMEVYTLCSSSQSGGPCSFGPQCVEAHSLEELKEWKDRFEYRQKKIQRAAKLYGKSFVDTLLDKLASSNHPEKMLLTKMDKIECKVSSDKEIKLNNKGSEHNWKFTLSTKSKLVLRNVGLMNDESRQYFSLSSIKQCGHITNKNEDDNEDVQKTEDIIQTDSLDSASGQQQEWAHPDPTFVRNPLFSECSEMIYEVNVKFKTDIYGTFRQSIVFSFGTDPPYFRQDLCVEVTPQPDDDDGQLKELQDSIIQQEERWDSTNSKIIDFTPPLAKPPVQDELILKKYPSPKPQKFQATQNVVDTQLTKQNYRGRMHELLYIEEMAQFDHVSQFNVKTTLQLASKYLLTPTSTNSSTAKYARPGELFGKMKLGNNLSEDTSAGRLILTNCPNLLISVTIRQEKIRDRMKNKPNDENEEETNIVEDVLEEIKESKSKASPKEQRIAYVVGIEDTGKSTLYLRLPSTLITKYDLKDEEDFEVEVQFQLNRLPLCEMHHAVDRLPDLSLVYPDIREKIVIPWSPGKQWGDDFNAKLNPKQREAVVAITTPLVISLPPILIIGPYGTGKTFTLGQAIKMLLKQENNRKILVCTHSNSAADLYIREYLHPFIEKEKEESQKTPIKLLRVYYENRWVQTVNQTVQQYCLITMSESGNRKFRYPSLEDVIDCDVVVATLSTSRYLNGIGLKPGHFTHILLDEAAQAMECEAIMPMSLSSNKTRVVLAGDHMQLSPEVFSGFAMQKKFNKSLLERLYDLYPQSFACKILLCENYRSHEAIINYTSELFYEQKLIASGKQASHETWYPLTMFTARGEDIQDVNSTSFYNNSEVYEVVERVAELQRTWPKKHWGERDENAIGIVTPYYDQVQRIRSELRKRRLFGVSVERVLNVQGKQFRAIFLSTVRTRKTCISSQEDVAGGDLDFGFLSNAKLLNTAITRAQSLVAVVGDPIALCSMGKCRKLWERFMSICQEHKSLMGITYSALRIMLDNVEMKKAYVLNPLAPEFIPRAKRYNETFLKIFNDSLKQILNAAASSSNSASASQFPNVLGGTGLVPPPPMPPFGYPVNPQGFFPPGVGGFIPPPPRPPHPPPLHPAAARRLPGGPIPGPFNPYMTIPPMHPPMPPPWGMRPPPVPEMAIPPAQMLPNIPIPPPSMQVGLSSSGVTTPTNPGMGIFNHMPGKQRPGGMMGNPLASSNPNLSQLAPPSARGPTTQNSTYPRNVSPFQGNNATKISFSQAPPANPQFANTKFQRGTTSSSSPVNADNARNSNAAKSASATSLNETPGESTTIIPELDPSFIYLQGGVHFPQQQSSKPATNLSAIVPNKFTDSSKPAKPKADPQPQINNIQNDFVGPTNTQVVDQQNKDRHPLYMKEEKNPPWFEMALDILPQDFEITSLLQSPQIQKAWYNQLTISRGPKEAGLFQELIINLQQKPDLIMLLKEQMIATKILKASSVPPMSNTERGNLPFGREKPAILAEDLEAMLLNESDNSKVPNLQRSPVPGNFNQSAALSQAQQNMASRFLGVRQQTPVSQSSRNDGNIFAPASSSGDAFFSMIRGNNGSSESSFASDRNSSTRTPLQTDRRPDGVPRNTENSIEDIYNDPILSEILRNNSNSSPDSGVFNSDSVTSLLGQQSALFRSTQNIDWQRNLGNGEQTPDSRAQNNYERLFGENSTASASQNSSAANEESGGGYVPLYLRRAGGSSAGNTDSNIGFNDNNSQQQATAATTNDRKYLPLTISTQHNNSPNIGNSRFTIDPISSPGNDFIRHAQFERERSVMPDFAKPPPPLSAPPDRMPHHSFSNPPNPQQNENQQQKQSNDPNKPMSYAKILAAPPKTAKEREIEAAMADPINRIRQLGTMANQDDQIAGALGAFGIGGGLHHQHMSSNENLLRQQEESQYNAAWINTFNKQW